jgi:hypothetical protein
MRRSSFANLPAQALSELVRLELGFARIGTRGARCERRAIAMGATGGASIRVSSSIMPSHSTGGAPDWR